MQHRKRYTPGIQPEVEVRFENRERGSKNGAEAGTHEVRHGSSFTASELWLCGPRRVGAT
eukprot:3177000-Rhodomonas_salina.2